MWDGFSVCFPMGTWTWSLSVGSYTNTSLQYKVSCSLKIREKNAQLIAPTGREIVCDVNIERPVPAHMSSSFLPVNKNSSLIIDSTEVEDNAIASGPGARHIKSSLIPAPNSVLPHNTCTRKQKPKHEPQNLAYLKERSPSRTAPGQGWEGEPQREANSLHLPSYSDTATHH